MIKNTITPPPQPQSNNFNALIVHDISDLYKKLYTISKKISKRDKFGIFLNIEKICLEALSLSIKAAFTPKVDKAKFISQLRVVVELLKNLVRVAYELSILSKDHYLDIQFNLQKISKMGAGWLKYAQ